MNNMKFKKIKFWLADILEELGFLVIPCKKPIDMEPAERSYYDNGLPVPTKIPPMPPCKPPKVI